MTDADTAIPRDDPGPAGAGDPWTRWLPGPARRLTDRYLPRGAVVLGILTLAYFVVRQVQNRVLANTFGLGTELDIYYVAVRIPEVALDLLVAAGLTAPFVPIFNGLRHDDDREAQRVRADGPDGGGRRDGDRRRGPDPRRPAHRRRGRRQPRRGRPGELYVDLFRINCLTPVLFAASIAIGEVLVANRRFLFYALAPILYTARDRSSGRCCSATRWASTPPAGARSPAPPPTSRSGRRARSGRRFRYRPALAVRTPAFREFVRLMLPRMVSYPIDPDPDRVLRGAGADVRRRAARRSLTFADGLPGVPVILIAQQFSLARVPVALRGRRRRRPARLPVAPVAEHRRRSAC